MEQLEAEMQEKLAAWADIEEALEQSEIEKQKIKLERDSFKSIF